MSKPNICVATYFTPSYRPLAAITTAVLQDYCHIHGYQLYQHEVDNGQNLYFVKTAMALQQLEAGFDIVFAVDCDVLITNYKINIEDFVDSEHDFYCCKDVNGVNTGTFIVKNTWWAKNVLQDVYNRKELSIRYHDEQNVYEQIHDAKVKHLAHPSINSIPYEFYKPSYGYIGYKQGETREKPTHEMGCWQQGDFICHLPGKTLSERIEIFNELKEQIIYE
jgi:hypothetical protein